MVEYCSHTTNECGLTKCKLRGCILNKPILSNEMVTDTNEVVKVVKTESVFRPRIDLNTVATKVRKKKSLNIIEKSYLNWINTQD